MRGAGVDMDDQGVLREEDGVGVEVSRSLNKLKQEESVGRRVRQIVGGEAGWRGELLSRAPVERDPRKGGYNQPEGADEVFSD